MDRRLFVAIELPEWMREKLAALDPGVDGLRRVRPGQIHLTLAFLAKVPDEAVSLLMDALSAIRMEPFDLRLRGLGCFGGRGRPAVLWAGVENPPDPLFFLRGQVLRAAKSVGLVPDERAFHPHVTVARGKHVPEGALRSFVESRSAWDIGVFEVRGFTLFASRLAPEGAAHEPLLSHDFTGPD